MHIVRKLAADHYDCEYVRFYNHTHLDVVSGVLASSKMKPVAVEDTEIPKLLDDLIELLVQEEVEVDDGDGTVRCASVLSLAMLAHRFAAIVLLCVGQPHHDCVFDGGIRPPWSIEPCVFGCSLL
jgi:hypothetical protein